MALRVLSEQYDAEVPADVRDAMRTFAEDAVTRAREQEPPSNYQLYTFGSLPCGYGWGCYAEFVMDTRYHDVPYINVHVIKNINPRGSLVVAVDYTAEDQLRLDQERLRRLKKQRDEISGQVAQLILKLTKADDDKTLLEETGRTVRVFLRGRSVCIPSKRTVYSGPEGLCVRDGGEYDVVMPGGGRLSDFWWWLYGRGVKVTYRYWDGHEWLEGEYRGIVRGFVHERPIALPDGSYVFRPMPDFEPTDVPGSVISHLWELMYGEVRIWLEFRP